MKPTSHMRFIERGGKKILQQWWDCLNGTGFWDDISFADVATDEPPFAWEDEK